MVVKGQNASNATGGNEEDGIETPDGTDEIKVILAVGEDKGPFLLRASWRVWVALAIATGVAVFFWVRGSADHGESVFTTETIVRDRLTVTVTATGTTQPRNEVSVGIEVSGTVDEVFVDYNDTVQQGQLLARLDIDILSAEVAQARASLEMSRASKMEAEATLLQAESDLTRLLKLREVSAGALPSAQDLDAAEATRARAMAMVASAEAQARQSAAVLVAKQTELAKADVVSPIRGVVLSRLVDPGQTVAASLQTPELFVIAEDLREIELSIEIDEADVGQVREGQPAQFTVDAYPDEEFPAEIVQVRYAPSSNAGVVTYEAILAVDNSDLRLRPGMTATAVITVRQSDGILLVPNEALRFTPRLEVEEAEESRGFASMLIPRPPSGSPKLGQVESKRRQRQVWILSETGQPRSVEVLIGASNGGLTEVVSGELSEGARVIVEQEEAP
jgi:HlyD family secretion protein